MNTTNSDINPVRENLRQEGFALIDDTLTFLIDSLSDSLTSLGEDELIPFLPWRNVTPDSTPPEGTQQLYSIGFQLLNMVEERVSAAIRRERENELGAASIRGLWARTLKDMKDLGLDEEQILDVLKDVHVEPVLTAHPTEAKRATVRERHRAIYEELARSEHPKYTDRERRRIKANISAAMETLWRTGEIHMTRPDLKQELRNALYYLREMYPAVLNRLDTHFTEAWRDAGFSVDRLRNSGKLPRVTFGTWIGGDRDGHPLVTPEVTYDTLADLRYHAIVLMRKELKELAFHLTISKQFQEIPEALTERIQEISHQIGNPSYAADILHQNREEPWRQLVYLMRGMLFDTGKGTGNGYQRPEELDADLALLEKTLLSTGCLQLIKLHVTPLRHKLSIFGFHLATIDIRQNSEHHDAAVSQLLVAAGIDDGENFDTWSEEKRCEFLSAELLSARPFLHDTTSAGAEADSVLDSYRVIADQIGNYGMGGIGAFIVSMTRSVSDLLVVYLLQREAGILVQVDGGLASPIEVVPLYETKDDLDSSQDLLAGFLDHPLTQRSYKLRYPEGNPFQQVMLGYSDSNKDCGILSAQWSLYRAEKAMVETAAKRGIRLNYFHGRGGTISRGAGPTQWFMEALPHGSLSGHFRMTEQGETIAQKYANLSNATFNIELLIASAATTAAKHKHAPAPVDPCIQFMPALSDGSEKAYQKLLKTEGFIPFYREATIIDALENSRIGSRPSRRTGKKDFSLDDLRAIPWVFSWTQARFYLTGWFGVGSALNGMRENNPADYQALKDGLKESTFLQYALTNVETNLASANRELMITYGELCTDDLLKDTFMEIILTEFDLTKELLFDIFNGDFEQRRPRMSKTLAIREEPLKVLHHQQVALIKQWRALKAEGKEEEAETLFPKILLSINAISSGLRTTG